MSEIADIIKIATKHIEKILLKHFLMKIFMKKSLRRFPSIDRKQQRVDDSGRGLEIFTCYPNGFLCGFVVMYKNRYIIIQLCPISSLQNDRTGRKSSKAVQKSVEKILSINFWNAC